MLTAHLLRGSIIDPPIKPEVLEVWGKHEIGIAVEIHRASRHFGVAGDLRVLHSGCAGPYDFRPDHRAEGGADGVSTASGDLSQ